MKNLNIEKAEKRNLISVKSVRRLFIYSLCMVLFLLTSSLSSRAQVTGSDAAHADTSVVLTTFSPGFDWYMNSFYNDGSGLTNNWGATNSGNDYWIKITVPRSGYLQVYCGTVSNDTGFDSAVHLLDSSGEYELTSGDDDGGGSYGTGGVINYYVDAGVYYVILDGTDKPGWSIVRNGGIGIDFSLTYDVNP